MPTNVLPGAWAVRPWTTTWRGYITRQLPHDRYSLPKPSTWNPRMTTVPAPLCWNTLSDADLAPPPTTVATWPADVPLKVAASSPTSSHHTFVKVHAPRQWMPSAAGLPMITLDSEAPSASSKTGFWPSLWVPSPMAPLATNRFRPPSRAPFTTTVDVTGTVAVAVGQALGAVVTGAELAVVVALGVDGVVVAVVVAVVVVVGVVVVPGAVGAEVLLLVVVVAVDVAVALGVDVVPTVVVVAVGVLLALAVGVAVAVAEGWLDVVVADGIAPTGTTSTPETVDRSTRATNSRFSTPSITGTSNEVLSAR